MLKKELQKLVSLNTDETEDFAGRITFYKKECEINVFIGEDYCSIQIKTLRGKPFFQFFMTNIRQDVIGVTVILETEKDKKEFTYTKIYKKEEEEMDKINEIMDELQEIESIREDLGVVFDIVSIH